MFKWKHLQKPKRARKSHNKQPKAFACFGLILSQKQDRAMKINKKQETTNGNTPQKPKRATKSNKEHFPSHVHSFIPTLDLWKVAGIKSNEKPERAATGSAKQEKAMKSNEKQKRTSELQKPKRAIKGTKSANGNQA